jgi:hypothetical protein
MASAATKTDNASTLLACPKLEKKSTLFVDCGETRIRKWNNSMWWVCTTKLRQGCFAVAIVSKKLCYLKHVGDLNPHYSGPRKGKADKYFGGSETYLFELANEVVEDCQVRKDDLEDAQLIIVAPVQREYAPEDKDELLAGPVIEHFGLYVEKQTKLKAHFLRYDSKKR